MTRTKPSTNGKIPMNNYPFNVTIIAEMFFVSQPDSHPPHLWLFQSLKQIRCCAQWCLLEKQVSWMLNFSILCQSQKNATDKIGFDGRDTHQRWLMNTTNYSFKMTSELNKSPWKLKTQSFTWLVKCWFLFTQMKLWQLKSSE